VVGKVLDGRGGAEHAYIVPSGLWLSSPLVRGGYLTRRYLVVQLPWWNNLFESIGFP
jgi:hypothetical protein